MTAPEIASSTSSPSPYPGKPKHHHHHHHHHTTSRALVSPDPQRKGGLGEVESALNRSLRNENDVLRCQLNDLISREKSQRIEIQRLRQQRESDVNSLVHTTTSELKSEVEQLKGMLQSTSGQLLQALSDREQARSQKEKCARLLEETKQAAATQESHLTKRVESLEQIFKASLSLTVSITQNVDAFQRHVLPTFKPSSVELNYNSTSEMSPDAQIEGKELVDQLTRLGSSLALLRVIVDAKNDTLVLIRGKLKQENEELRAELQVAQEVKHRQLQAKPFLTPVNDDNNCDEKNEFLRQELLSMQDLFNEEVNRLNAKLKMYESEEQHGQGRLVEIQRELTELQNKLSHVEASRASLEVNLKEETSARTQLVSQLFALRKENEKIKTELETLKLSQKFLVRQPRNGHLPMEKMDLMSTVNQLLNELNRTKGEKVSLEEELKAQRISHMRDRVKRSVTPRDVEMAAANKVADSELAMKLARARLQQLALQDNSINLITAASRDGSTHSTKQPSPCNIERPTALSIQCSQSLAVPFKDEIMCSPSFYTSMPRKSSG